MMDLGHECPNLLARCVEAQPYTLDEYVEACRAFLAELLPLHPGFGHYHFVTDQPTKHPALASDLSNLKDWIWKNCWRRQQASYYSNKTPEGELTGASVGPFYLSLSNWAGFDGKFDLGISFGNTATRSRCVMMLPRKDHPEFLQGPLPMQLFELVLKHWPVRFASYGLGGWNKHVNWVGAQQDSVGCFELGWHTFVDDPSVADFLPSDVPVRQVGKGIVFSLFERMPDYNNPEHVERGQRVRQALLEAGKLRLYPPPWPRVHAPA